MNFEDEENLSLIPQCMLENMMMSDDDDVIAGRQIGHDEN